MQKKPRPKHAAASTAATALSHASGMPLACTSETTAKSFQERLRSSRLGPLQPSTAYLLLALQSAERESPLRETQQRRSHSISECAATAAGADLPADAADRYWLRPHLLLLLLLLLLDLETAAFHQEIACRRPCCRTTSRLAAQRHSVVAGLTAAAAVLLLQTTQQQVPLLDTGGQQQHPRPAAAAAAAALAARKAW